MTTPIQRFGSHQQVVVRAYRQIPVATVTAAISQAAEYLGSGLALLEVDERLVIEDDVQLPEPLRKPLLSPANGALRRSKCESRAGSNGRALRTLNGRASG